MTARRQNIHLRVEEAGGGFDNRGSTVKGGNREDGALGVGDHSHQRQGDVLRLHVEGEGVRDLLRLSSANLEVIRRGSQVAHDALVSRCAGRELLSRLQSTSKESERDRSRLIVDKGNEGFGGVAVDKLHAEDVRLREGGGDFSIELRSVDRGRASILSFELACPSCYQGFPQAIGSLASDASSRYFMAAVCRRTYLSNCTEQLSCEGGQQ